MAIRGLLAFVALVAVAFGVYYSDLYPEGASLKYALLDFGIFAIIVLPYVFITSFIVTARKRQFEEDGATQQDTYVKEGEQAYIKKVISFFAPIPVILSIYWFGWGIAYREEYIFEDVVVPMFRMYACLLVLFVLLFFLLKKKFFGLR